MASQFGNVAGPGDDVAGIVAGLKGTGTGGTLFLRRGTYRLKDTLRISTGTRDVAVVVVVVYACKWRVGDAPYYFTNCRGVCV